MVQRVHHPAFPQPPSDNVKIWRYLTKNKFEWMVTEGRLFMPAAAHLGDELEGTQPPGNAHWWQSLANSASTPEQRGIIDHNRELIARFAAAFRTRYYVSCWHVNENVNSEMWKLYANTSESVALCTTFGRLRATLPAYVDIGLVRYIDYSKERLPTLNMLEYITHKNKCFEHEQELRAVAMHPVVKGLDQEHFQAHHFEDEKTPDFQVYAPRIKVADMVSCVFIHPEAQSEFVASTKELCEKNVLPKPERSNWWPSSVA